MKTIEADSNVIPVASGLIAGESPMGIAILDSAGVVAK